MSRHTPGPWTADEGEMSVAPSDPAIPGRVADCRSAADARLIAAAPDLLEAAKLAAAWMWDPDESPHVQFERVAEWFHRETHFLRPGKSEPLESASNPDERRAAWEAWGAEKNRGVLAALRAAIAKAKGEVKS